MEWGAGDAVEGVRDCEGFGRRWMFNGLNVWGRWGGLVQGSSGLRWTFYLELGRRYELVISLPCQGVLDENA